MIPGRAFDYTKRSRRPPKDPLNALLSFAYSLLTKDWTVTLHSVGFDPLMGFYHQPRYGRPALALDLMEPFRPVIAESVVVGVVNNGEVGGVAPLRRASVRNEDLQVGTHFHVDCDVAPLKLGGDPRHVRSVYRHFHVECDVAPLKLDTPQERRCAFHWISTSNATWPH